MVASGLRWLTLGLDNVLCNLFDLYCVGCGAPVSTPTALCASCQKPRRVEGILCEHCGTPVPHACLRCGICFQWPSALKAVRSDGWLDDGQRRWLHAVKYGRWSQLIPRYPFSLMACQSMDLPPDCQIIPVPLHPKRWIERGFNQSELIAKALADRIGLAICADGLLRSGTNAYQARLGKNRRDQNVKGRFTWNPRVAVPKSALLIDDVFTTGATVTACARAMARAGVEQIYGWTLFRAPLWSDKLRLKK